MLARQLVGHLFGTKQRREELFNQWLMHNSENHISDIKKYMSDIIKAFFYDPIIEIEDDCVHVLCFSDFNVPFSILTHEEAQCVCDMLDADTLQAFQKLDKRRRSFSYNNRLRSSIPDKTLFCEFVEYTLDTIRYAHTDPEKLGVEVPLYTQDEYSHLSICFIHQITRAFEKVCNDTIFEARPWTAVSGEIMEYLEGLLQNFMHQM